MKRAWLAVLLPALAACAGCVNGVERPSLQPFEESAYACLQRRDTEHPLFHGCIDWHSSVHAHWAVLRFATVTGSEDAAVHATLERLAGPALDRERVYLAAHPAFEMPYGRAWFLALAVEHARLTGNARLTPMAEEIARSLRTWMAARAVDPLTREYGNHTWALVQLYRYYQSRDNQAGMGWVEDQVDAHFLAYREAAALGADHDRADFFSLWGNWAHLLAVVRPEALETWLAAQTVSDAALVPVKNFRSDHQLGMNASRAWGLWWVGRHHPRFRRAYTAHVEAILTTHREYADDYFAYGHWVPQFAMYALTR